MRKISVWAQENKVTFNETKTQVMMVTRKKARTQQKLRIYLNNNKIEETNTMKYLGIIIDKRFKFNKHIEHIADKSTKLIHALSRSAKINWGLRPNVMQIIYKGAILPLLSYGVTACIDTLNTQSNANRIRRVQRLINIKITKAYRTTSHEALNVVAGTIPIIIELVEIAKYQNIIRGRTAHNGERLDTVLNYRKWPHPANIINMQEKDEDMEYKFLVYTDGSKSEAGVGAGAVIYLENYPAHQLGFRLYNKCSNNQAEQLAILKALEKIKEYDHIHPIDKRVAVHTDSNITMDLLRNNIKHNNLIHRIQETMRTLQQQQWMVHFTWVKAHIGILGNELADRLAKEAATNSDVRIYTNE